MKSVILATALLCCTTLAQAQYFPSPRNADASNLNPGGNMPQNSGSNAYGAPGNGPLASSNPNSAVQSGAGTPTSQNGNANSNTLSLSRKR